MSGLGPASLALALQLCDSAFPGGGFNASWGLEGLHADGQVTDADAVSEFLVDLLDHRWATCDRWALHRAALAVDLDDVTDVDRIMERSTVIEPARAASKRAGAALLTTLSSMDVALAVELRASVRAGGAFGHLAVVQGAMWSSLGLDPDTIAVMSASAMAAQVTTAALRLGIIGHVDAQRLQLRVRPLIVDLVGRVIPDGPTAWTPAADTAMLAHQRRSVRMFSC
jgi:urease accessory protein